MQKILDRIMGGRQVKEWLGKVFLPVDVIRRPLLCCVLYCASGSTVKVFGSKWEKTRRRQKANCGAEAYEYAARRIRSLSYQILICACLVSCVFKQTFSWTGRDGIVTPAPSALRLSRKAVFQLDTTRDFV